MNWTDWFNTAAGAASLMGLVLAVILGAVSWRITRATDQLIKSTSEGTQTLISQTTANTQTILERMDQQANQRQREMMEAIQALKR
jgi:hypothetical protein